MLDVALEKGASRFLPSRPIIPADLKEAGVCQSSGFNRGRRPEYPQILSALVSQTLGNTLPGSKQKSQRIRKQDSLGSVVMAVVLEKKKKNTSSRRAGYR